MRHSDLWRLLGEEFGRGYAASLAHDHALSTLGSRTVKQALADGVPPRQVWLAVCEDFRVPPERRLGRDRPRRR